MIADVLAKIDLHKKRLESALAEIKQWEDIDCEIFEDFEKIKTTDTFIYRFIKLQDLMGDKLFKVFLNSIGEYRDTMSLIDILDKLEKLEIIENAREWMEFRNLRNQLTHEYPNNEQDIIDGILLAIKSYEKIDMIINNVQNYCISRRIK